MHPETTPALALEHPDPSIGTAFRLLSFTDPAPFSTLQRLNYYCILLVRSGSVQLHVDFSEYRFSGHTVLFFTPYQPFLLRTGDDFEGEWLQFHSDFYCIHKHQQEVACNGILFNNLYQPPFLEIDENIAAEFRQLILQMKEELSRPELAQQELLISYLKILLIRCTRIKQQQFREDAGPVPQAPAVLQSLKETIEAHFRKVHAPASYADMLHISPKALARLAKTHLNKTLTDLIAERIVIEAKRELYLSSKPVKAIAWELGFEDEYYFSRFFKKNTSVSPQAYRERVGFAKGEAPID